MNSVAIRVADAGADIYGLADHGVSIAPCFEDPDGNGIEIYWDRPRKDWPWQDDSSVGMGNECFELAPVLAEAG